MYTRSLIKAAAGDANDVFRMRREASEDKKRLVAMIAHELRGPLAAVRNAVDLLERTNVASEISLQAVGIAKRQLAHTARVIDDLFDLARIGENKLELRRERALLEDIVRIAVDSCQSRIAAAAIDLDIQIRPMDLRAFVDPTRLSQVISNLLSNAAKFTPAKGRIAVQCWESYETLFIKVQDSGIGMDPEGVALVFEPFEQPTKHVNDSGGLGLGLTIAKWIVEMHGGKIFAQSDGHRKGSTFTVVIPVQRNQFASPRYTSASAAVHAEWLLDESNRQSFPASDPSSASLPGSVAYERYAAALAAR